MSDERSPERLADRFAIQDALARYARGVDRRDWEFVQSAFHPGAGVDQGDYKGNAEGLIEGMKPRHQAIEQSMHVLTNCLIEFKDEDTALVETYYMAVQRVAALPIELRRMLMGDQAPADGKVDMRALGRYVDRFERRGGAWRIAKRVCLVETITGAAAPSGTPFSANWVVASRNSDDALCRIRAEIGLKGPVA